MSVLKLRRDMVVVDDETAAGKAAETDKPFPLRKIEPEAADEDVIEGEVNEDTAEEDADEEHHGKSMFQQVRFWFNAAVIVAGIGAYPAMVIASSDVGDHDIGKGVIRSDWTAPWVGGVASMMEKHFNDLGWASDTPA